MLRLLTRAPLRRKIPLVRLYSDKQKDFDDFLDGLMKPNQQIKKDFKSIQFKKNDEFDILDDFINKEIDVVDALAPLSKRDDLSKLEEVSGLSIIQNEVADDSDTDTDIFRNPNEYNPDVNQIVKDEKELFQYIFESYMKPMQHEQDEKKKKMHDLKHSIRSTNERIGSLVSPRNRNELSKVSLRLRNKIFEKSKEAISPTVEYINTLSTTPEVVEYYNEVLAQWNDLYTESGDKLFLTTLLKDSTDFTDKHIQFVEELHFASQNEPKFAQLNVITLPIIINQIFKTLSFKFYDGQLPLTLFNLLKKDITLYTLACNQETYNQILRILWIYHGKSNLYNIEMTFVEMKNNGFNGDLQTFNILKQIIMDYYDLKMGKADINKGTGLPIWSVEDDKRVRNLEGRLKLLGSVLNASESDRSRII